MLSSLTLVFPTLYSPSVILRILEVHNSAELVAGCFQGGLSLGDDLNGFARDKRGKPAQKHLQTVNTIEYVHQFGFRCLCQSSGCYLAFGWLGFDPLFVCHEVFSFTQTPATLYKCHYHIHERYNFTGPAAL